MSFEGKIIGTTEEGLLIVEDKKGELNVIVGAEGKKEMSFELIKVTVR